MRHSAAHLMAEAVQEMIPEVKFAIGPAIENGFYYDMDLPRPLDARRPRCDRGVDAYASGGRRGVHADGSQQGRGAQIFGDNPYKVEILKELPADSVISTYQQGVVPGPLQGSARPINRQYRRVQAPIGCRRVLARRREAADAAAHLRHGLAHAGGAR